MDRFINVALEVAQRTLKRVSVLNDKSFRRYRSRVYQAWLDNNDFFIIDYLDDINDNEETYNMICEDIFYSRNQVIQ